jgi:hypothetical protein
MLTCVHNDRRHHYDCSKSPRLFSFHFSVLGRHTVQRTQIPHMLISIIVIMTSRVMHTTSFTTLGRPWGPHRSVHLEYRIIEGSIL